MFSSQGHVILFLFVFAPADGLATRLLLVTPTSAEPMVKGCVTVITPRILCPPPEDTADSLEVMAEIPEQGGTPEEDGTRGTIVIVGEWAMASVDSESSNSLFAGGTR